MINESCLICKNNCTKFKNWNIYKILICDDCSFSFIKTSNSTDDGIFSETEENFYNRSIIRDKERSELFIKKIAKKRIDVYKKILKKKTFNILEIGCGSAVISEGFSQNGVNYTGIELDRNMYNFAVSKSRNVIYGNFLTTNINKKFDVLFASQVVEHMYDPNIFFKKCNEVLSKDGILHIDVPNDNSMISYLRKVHKNKKYYGVIRPPYHMRAYASKSLKKLFLKHNFYNMKIFSKYNLDRTYGQIVESIPLKINLLFRLQQLTGNNSLLVGLAQKK